MPGARSAAPGVPAIMWRGQRGSEQARCTPGWRWRALYRRRRRCCRRRRRRFWRGPLGGSCRPTPPLLSDITTGQARHDHDREDFGEAQRQAGGDARRQRLDEVSQLSDLGLSAAVQPLQLCSRAAQGPSAAVQALLAAHLDV